MESEREDERQEVLIVEDDRDLCRLYEIQLSCEKCNIRLAYSIDQGWRLMEQLPDGTNSINIIDYYLDHGHTGVQFAIECNARGYNCTNILITGKNNDEVKRYIRDFELQMKFGGSLFTDILTKPVTGNQLRDSVNKQMNTPMQNYR